jgi:hypothetical protein
MTNIGIATFVTLLMLGTAIIGSGHIALARDFTNSGNYLVTNCTAGNSCNSSNTVTSGSSGLTSPPPSTAPTPTALTVSVTISLPPGQSPTPSTPILISGQLRTATGPVAGATITLTAARLHTTAETDDSGAYQAVTTYGTVQDSTITANYAGITGISLAASSGSFVVG